ncbi:TPA: ladinin 1-like, partial [Bos taurus]
LTRQSTLEDEEEQEREHQWQHQNLSFAMDDKDPPDPESTSVRLPASSVKLGPKLEQYLSAIQRSESVKCANPSHTEFLEAPVDVASKRQLFEKELVGQNREGPAASCKENLELSGLVKSRLRWISRIQESAQQGPQ